MPVRDGYRTMANHAAGCREVDDPIRGSSPPAVDRTNRRPMVRHRPMMRPGLKDRFWGNHMGADMPPSSSANDVFLAASIARRFYLENRSKSEIADEFMINRFKVARILSDAVAQGIVKIDVTVPVRMDLELAAALKERFRLSHV